MTRRLLFKTLLVFPWLGLLRLEGFRITEWNRVPLYDGPHGKYTQSAWVRWVYYTKLGKTVEVPCCMTDKDILLNVWDPKKWAQLMRAMDENARDSAKWLWNKKYGHRRDEAHTIPKA